MGTETYYLKKFVEKNKLQDGALINKKDLELFFVDSTNVAYTTLSSYFYILKLINALEQTPNKKVFKLNKKILDGRRD